MHYLPNYLSTRPELTFFITTSHEKNSVHLSQMQLSDIVLLFPLAQTAMFVCDPAIV